MLSPPTISGFGLAQLHIYPTHAIAHFILSSSSQIEKTSSRMIMHGFMLNTSSTLALAWKPPVLLMADNTSGQADQIQLSGSETEEASPAASAERHRIGASGAVDLRDIAVWLEKSFPYLALLFIIFLREHWLGILVSGCLTMNLKAANHILREQVMLKERRSNSRLWTMALVFGISFPAMIITVKTLSSQDLWPFFILLIPASIPTAWHAVVLAVAIDTLARCMGCAVKAAVLALHRATPDEAFRRRSSLLTLLEHTLLCYRVLLTSPIWFRYFLSMPGHFIPVGMAGFYLACKMHLFFKQIGIIFAAARVACRSEAVFGKNASSDEVMEVGNKCPICQENMQQPGSFRKYFEALT
ncbi:hypothetical protein WJX84_003524 [Apatococcus fuscideae]|uniref:Uncharacterized protein n=1 Tax=Apatococcus fuscideae TaxID=2026836 RepID=A0AAW1SQ24_9CHLO